MTRIILVRHGETEWNRVERFRGRADVPLNQTGMGQAEATARAIADRWRPAAVYSSPLSRAARTAESIARRFDLTAEVHPGFIDIEYGQWQGLTPEEAARQWPDPLAKWYRTPGSARIPGGESLDELRERCGGAIKEVVEKHPGSTVVVVSHTVVNRVILLLVLGLANDRFWRLRQDTCAINEIEADDGLFTLVSMNDTCHLHVTSSGAGLQPPSSNPGYRVIPPSR